MVLYANGGKLYVKIQALIGHTILRNVSKFKRLNTTKPNKSFKGFKINIKGSIINQ